MVNPLGGILLLCLLAVLAGAESVTDIVRFGEKKLALLRRFRRSSMGRQRTIISATSSPRAEALRRCFVARVSALIKAPTDVIAIDGAIFDLHLADHLKREDNSTAQAVQFGFQKRRYNPTIPCPQSMEISFPSTQ